MMDSETVSGLHVRIPGSQGIAGVKSEKEIDGKVGRGQTLLSFKLRL